MTVKKFETWTDAWGEVPYLGWQENNWGTCKKCGCGHSGKWEVQEIALEKKIWTGKCPCCSEIREYASFPPGKIVKDSKETPKANLINLVAKGYPDPFPNGCIPIGKTWNWECTQSSHQGTGPWKNENIPIVQLVGSKNYFAMCGKCLQWKELPKQEVEKLEESPDFIFWCECGKSFPKQVSGVEVSCRCGRKWGFLAEGSEVPKLWKQGELPDNELLGLEGKLLDWICQECDGWNFGTKIALGYINAYANITCKCGETTIFKNLSQIKLIEEKAPRIPEKLRSQKAKGLAWLQQTGARIVKTSELQPLIVLQDDEPERLEYFLSMAKGSAKGRKIFARPCPSKPRHGFVDSRVVEGVDDLLRMIEEIKKAGEEPEIALLPKIEAKFSAVASDNVVVIGQGNDGATAGKDSITLPVVGGEKISQVVFGRGYATVLMHAGIKEDGIFLEVVTPEGPTKEALRSMEENEDFGGITKAFQAELVQVRGGPKIPGRLDFVPERLEVVEVVDPGGWIERGDLIGWERKAEELRDKVGVVVNHVGGSLGSHVGIHCVLNKVPYVTSQEIVVGDVLEPEGGVRKVSAQSLRDLGRMIMEELDSPSNDAPPAWYHGGTAEVAISVLHSFVVWDLNEEWARRLVAWAIVMTARLATMAHVAEMRHWVSSGPGGKRNKSWPSGKFVSTYREWFNRALLRSSGRNIVYSQAFDSSAEKIWDGADWALRGFRTGGWDGAYGGANWASGAKTTRRLIYLLLRFVKVPSEENWQKAGKVWNLLVNQAHNGGLLLNKFMENARFDFAASWSGSGFLAGPGMELVWKIVKEREDRLTWPEARERAIEVLKGIPKAPTLRGVRGWDSEKGEIKEGVGKSAGDTIGLSATPKKSKAQAWAKTANKLPYTPIMLSPTDQKPFDPIEDIPKVSAQGMTVQVCAAGPTEIHIQIKEAEMDQAMNRNREYGGAWNIDGVEKEFVQEIQKRLKAGLKLESLATAGSFKYVKARLDCTLPEKGCSVDLLGSEGEGFKTIGTSIPTEVLKAMWWKGFVVDPKKEGPAEVPANEEEIEEFDEDEMGDVELDEAGEPGDIGEEALLDLDVLTKLSKEHLDAQKESEK